MKRSTLRLAAFALFAAAVGGGIIAAHARSLSSDVSNAVALPRAAVQTLFAPDPKAIFGKSSIRVLVVGLDYDYNALDEESSKQSRSDIIMALDLDLAHHRVFELSVPRDMIATMPNGAQAKINQAQSDGGIRESRSVIARWLGAPPFDRYVVMRIDTSKDVVNAIGGIDVDVKNSDALRGTGSNGPIDYDDSWGHLHIHLRPGLQHLDGEHAVAYARFRHDWCSDPCRIMRQQQVIRAIVDTLKRDKIRTLARTGDLLNVVRKDVDTDFTPQEEVATVVALTGLRPSDIRTAQVPYVSSTMLPGYGDSLIADDDAKRRLVHAWLANGERRQAP